MTLINHSGSCYHYTVNTSEPVVMIHGLCCCTQTPEDIQDPVFIVEVLLHLTKESARSVKTSAVKPCPPGDKGEMQVGHTGPYVCVGCCHQVTNTLCVKMHAFEQFNKILYSCLSAFL